MSPKIYLIAAILMLLQACSSAFPDAEKMAAVRVQRPCAKFGSPTVELGERAVRYCIERYNGVIQQEYNSWLRQDPTLKGAVVLQIDARPDGEINSISMGEGSDLPTNFASHLMVFIRSYILLPPSSSGWKGEYTLNFFPE